MKRIITILPVFIICIMPGFGDKRSSEWENVRNVFIKEHPVCGLCGTGKDLQVHHIRPFHLYPELELDPGNLIVLCVSKYWGFSCHLIAGHGCNFNNENPWILEDIEKLKIVGDPHYIKEHGDSDLEDYIRFIRKRVKKYNQKYKND